MNLGLANKRVLVTGGNSGLGAAMSKAFAAEGARVAINYLTNPEQSDKLVDEVTAAGGQAFAVMADIRDAAAVEATFRAIDAAWGGIDILVNNAGIDGSYSLGWEGDVEAWCEVIDVNLKGTYLCTREALKRMVAQRSGVVLNTTSVHEVIGWTGYSAYTASKAGVSMMSKSLAQEAAPHGVRVLCIAPGAIRTPINQAVWQDAEGHKDLLTKIPLRRIGEPEDVASMAIMLSSEAARYVTGTTVFVDGGMTDYPSFAHGG
ncbi:3-oxoacyl-ACP reductase FabG [Rhizobium sp. S9]|uniref:3-oxoacyl-ACP reductase FabG n=1 Tax=unclassified Rhizobium TaxID=2613769 RepID=UPI000A210A77|nr:MULTISPECIES: 3-oxoacyl-ACP reductase FabG [unclassified Rhizobium]ARO27674.1 glucose 1-dehydrogenase protein [Rhizobium sp. TAL182]PDS99442.1 3-oxoacyl-ACP reductase FabG [Rhizobium sp. S9]